MRRFGYCVGFASIVLLGQISFAVNPSFSDASSQVQKDQQSCLKPDKVSYDASCIHNLSAEYRALYDAASAMTSETIDPTNPLASLAQKQAQQYQKVIAYIEQNAKGLMLGKTVLPDSLLGGSSPTAGSAAIPPPAAPTILAASTSPCSVSAPSPSSAPGNAPGISTDIASGIATYTYQITCPSGVAPSAMAIDTSEEPLAIPSGDGIVYTGYNPVGDKDESKWMTFTFPPGATSYAVKFQAPAASKATLRAKFYIASGANVNLATCRQTPTGSGCFVGEYAIAREVFSHGGKVTKTRLMGGVDVSAASSTNPTARFFADAATDIPLARPSMRINSPYWVWGYARLASISQPGALVGATNLSTYVKPLTSATPEQTFQSGEATIGFAYQFTKFDKKGKNEVNNPLRNSVLTFSGIAGGGFITPLSANQTTPAIYVASPAIQNYWAKNTADAGNAAVVKAACASSSSTGPCYLAYLPQDRSRFYRNWQAGLRMKEYFWNTWDNSYDFPAVFDLTLGQNEYVTGGSMRGFVLHVGGSTPISKFPGVYIFGSADLVLTTNQSSQNFLLQSAPSTVNINDPSVAQLFVQQPNRDRYRFGVGLDLVTILSKLHATAATAATATTAGSL